MKSNYYVKFNCFLCGKEHKKNKYDYAKREKHFCSSSCAAKYNRNIGKENVLKEYKDTIKKPITLKDKLKTMTFSEGFDYLDSIKLGAS